MAELTYREALNQALREEMRRDSRVFIIGEEVAYYQGTYKVTQNLLAEFGEQRVVDTPIAEEGIVGTAIGAAMTGLRPVAELMTVNFSLLAMDMIVNHAAKIRLMFNAQVDVPMVIRMPQSAGNQLGAQHSQLFEAYFMHCPGLRVVLPATPADAKGLLKTAIRDNNPVIFLENQSLYSIKGDVPAGEYLLPLGKANVIREGEEITLISYSKMVHECLAAAEELAKDNISAEVIDLRCLNPLDKKTIFDSVKKTRFAIVVNEAWYTGSAGAEIASLINENCFEYLDAPVKRISAYDIPMPYNKNLEQAVLPHKDDIEKVAKRLLMGEELWLKR
ncbi:MAG: pyruvate dehydrogenase [Candidatus Melainabacteria bacterium GWF2_37_15]|nr:MAG: pyruvate dehydrogenase [Candidatus Melainabacteria bacterium GWF2_37_15]